MARNQSEQTNDVANPGSALGEAIGALLEAEIHRILKPLAEENGYIYVTTGPVSQRTGKATKLILTDSDGIGFNIDSVIINNRFQPLVLIESKYLRYGKHNRDKASWICTAHTKLRQRYSTVRRSIAVLMGKWSKPSKRLLQSFEVELFEISFDDICQTLKQHGINYRWAERDRQQAIESWRKFNELSDHSREQIAKELISSIKSKLRQALRVALDESVPRELDSVTLVIRSNRGETYRHVFPALDQAIGFMQSFDEERDMDNTSAPSLLMETGKEERKRR